MTALAARTAARRSTLLDGRDANVVSMDSIAARFFEGGMDAKGELGEETVAGADPEVGIEYDAGTRTIGRGTVDDDDPSWLQFRLLEGEAGCHPLRSCADG